MPYWLISAHGRMPVFDKSEMERLKGHGWTLLNDGESPLPQCRSCKQYAGHYDDCEVGMGVVTLSQAVEVAKRKPGRPKKAK